MGLMDGSRRIMIGNYGQLIYVRNDLTMTICCPARKTKESYNRYNAILKKACLAQDKIGLLS